MRTQCPKCQQINNVPDGFKGRTVTCSFCEHVFTAESYLETMLAERNYSKSAPKRAGDTWYLISYLIGMLGGLCVIGLILRGNFAALLVLIPTYILCYLAVTFGRILNRLEDIGGQLDQLGRDMKQNKSE